MAVVSAREFNRDVSAAKRKAQQEPVIITDRGRASHVLLSIGDYERLRGKGTSLTEALRMDEDEYFEFEFERIPDESRPVEW